MIPIKLQKTEEGKFIVKLDATAISKSACFKRFWRSAINGLHSPLNSTEIEFGVAFHIFAKELELTKGDLIKSLTPAQEYFKYKPKTTKYSKTFLSVEYLTEVCSKYFNEVYKTDLFKTFTYNDEPFVEINFAIPLKVTDIAEYYLSGTIDRLITIGNNPGPVSILDYKSTGKYPENADSYFLKFEMVTQIFCYVYALIYTVMNFPEHPLSSLIKPEEIPSAFIRGIFVPSGSKVGFKTSRRIEIQKSKLEEWSFKLDDLINKIDYLLTDPLRLDLIREGLFNDACTEGYTLCPFFGACNAPDQVAEERIIRQNFMQTEYDPLNFSKKDEILKQILNQNES